MSRITTHVLDTSLGKPAQGISVMLEQFQASGWVLLSRGITDSDGRIGNLTEGSVPNGIYRLRFEVSAYFLSQNKKTFYPSVQIEFEITDNTHYHVPLLLNPFGYTTYRGS